MAVETLQPEDKGTFLNQSAATTNYGAITSLQLRDYLNNAIRAIPEFDISMLPAHVKFNSATLMLYYYSFATNDPVGRTMWAHKLSRTDWVEAEATWNIYKTGSNWTAPGGDYVEADPVGGSLVFPAGFGWMSFDIKEIVKEAYDNSNPVELLLKFADETKAVGARSTAYFYSGDYVGDLLLRPKLIIDYTIMAPAVWDFFTWG